MSVPAQNDRTIFIAVPRTPLMAMAPTMAHGTAVAAFVASSEMCTLESNDPIVHAAANQLRKKAKPSGHPFKFVKFPRANEALFILSFGVKMGKAMRRARQSLYNCKLSIP